MDRGPAARVHRGPRRAGPGEFAAFVAVPVPGEVRDRVAEIVTRVRAETPGAERARWVRLDGLHVTIRFLGATPLEAAPTLHAAVDRAAAANRPFEVVISGAGAFPGPARPRTVWLAVPVGAAGLGRLAETLGDALAEAGWPRETRPFSAHLTVARTDGVSAGPAIARALIAAAAGLEARFTADRLVLFESRRSADGGPARYEPLHEALLTGDAGTV